MRERAPGIHDLQQAVLAQLEDFDQNGLLDVLTVNTWREYIATASSGYPDGTASTALDKAHEFEAWADQNSHSL
ncbi:HTH domain-containing protein [Halococcus sp. PRR34]|uniref:Uncharacterized protein n=1 Tax=Halococcus salifodinae DSM 8989 TaxID=1227456 RepID=M0MS19_9EURY|nr:MULTISPECIES: HTH domain-containing protein [Halococcus]EMA48421.1 hypothetical protein C450_19796 [Halococcus salifodinae DSM 8989]